MLAAALAGVAASRAIPAARAAPVDWNPLTASASVGTTFANQVDPLVAHGTRRRGL